jgi:hypothetical protein
VASLPSIFPSSFSRFRYKGLGSCFLDISNEQLVLLSYSHWFRQACLAKTNCKYYLYADAVLCYLLLFVYE